MQEGLPVRVAPFFVAGPCSLESDEVAFEAASWLSGRFSGGKTEWIFKGSFLKDNRSSASGYRGPGLEAGLAILAAVKREFGVRVTTDVHEPSQAEKAAETVDLLQIPAFLCRQTSLLEAAGSTGRPVNVKKGQFMAPGLMAGAVEKLRNRGCPEVWLTERGTFFGYGDLVVDFRSLGIMAGMADRVLLDVTHSLQLPGAAGDRSGGRREFAVRLARAGAAWGVDGMFFEIHPDPARALSDSDVVLDAATAGDLVEAALEHWTGVGTE